MKICLYYSNQHFFYTKSTITLRHWKSVSQVLRKLIHSGNSLNLSTDILVFTTSESLQFLLEVGWFSEARPGVTTVWTARVSPLCELPGGHGGAYGRGVPRLSGAPPCLSGGDRRQRPRSSGPGRSHGAGRPGGVGSCKAVMLAKVEA